MNNNKTLNIDALTPSRQTLLTAALAGHSVSLSAGKFTDMSRESLSKIGLTPIEIAALEIANGSDGASVSLLINKGSTPSSENNPYAKDNWNPDAQRALADSNPTLARKLMKEAGLLQG